MNKLTNHKQFWFLLRAGKTLVFSLAGAPLSVSHDGTREVNLLYCRSPRKILIELPGDFVTKVRRILKQPIRFNFDVEFCLSIVPHHPIFCLHHFNLSRPCTFNLYNLCQTVSNYICREAHQCALHFNEKITSTHSLLLQPFIRPVPAQSYFAVERVAKTLRRMSSCTPVNVPAKITWSNLLKKIFVSSNCSLTIFL